MTAAVSVILPTYERASLLPQSLDSVLAQSHPPAQVIVVDDGSTDDTARVLSAYTGRVTIIRKSNGGKPDAINAALPLIEGDYIWIFDDDDIACPDALARHLEVLERRPEVGFTYSGCYRCHDAPDGALIVDGAFPVRQFEEDEFYLELLLSCYVAGPAVVVRTAVQRAAGPYRADMLRSEDLEMATRWGLIARGARLDEPRPAYYRRTHAGARGAARERFAVGESVARAREYERRIMRELGARIDLNYYLPHLLWQAPVSPEGRVRALLRRWVVYMQKGLWEEALADLSELTHAALGAPAILADVRQFGPRALSDRRTRVELARQPAVMRELFGLLRVRQIEPLRWYLLRQLYHCARAELAAHEWHELAATTRMAGRLLGAPWQGRRAAPRPSPSS